MKEVNAREGFTQLNNFAKGEITAKRYLTGFTLIEILVYIAVFLIVILTIATFILWLVQSATKAKVMRETLHNVRRSMEIMTYEIKTAKSIAASSTSNHLYLGNGTTTEFYLCGSDANVLCQKKGEEDPALLTSDKVQVSNLEFVQIATLAVPSLQINFKVDYKNPNNRAEYEASVNATSTVSLRSY